MKAAPAIGFRHAPSRVLMGATVVVGALAVLAIWLTRGPAWLHVAATVLAAVYVVATLRAQLRPEVVAVSWRADGGANIRLRGGHAGPERELPGAVQDARVAGPLIVLTLRWPPRGRSSLWLLPDNLDADTRRRLRMRLGATGHGNTASVNADSR